MSITNSAGTVVWNNCYADGRPGACSMYMMLHPINAKGLYRINKTWNQRSGVGDGFVARGTYQLTTNFSSPSTTDRITFELVR